MSVSIDAALPSELRVHPAPTHAQAVAPRHLAPSDRPRLTVLMAAYDSARTIALALDSVLAEHDIVLECVVVDDGSTDGTPEIVAAIAARDPRVVLVRLDANQGVSNARNHGLDVSQGEWLIFLDADDRMLPGAVAALMAAADDGDALAVVGQRVWTDGRRWWLTAAYDIPDIRTPGRKSIASHPGLMYYASATGKAFHRSLIDGLRFHGRVLGDQPWTIRALLRAGDRIVVIDTTVFEWVRPLPGSGVETITTVKKKDARRAKEMVAIAREAFQAVSAEVDVHIQDAAVRQHVKQTYFDRLVRSDFTSPIRSSAATHDPATAGLFREITLFLEEAPPTLLAASEHIGPRILGVPAAFWPALTPATRSAYWAMLRTVATADPSIARRIGGVALLPLFAPVIRLAMRGAERPASGLLWIAAKCRDAALGARDRLAARPGRSPGHD